MSFNLIRELLECPRDNGLTRILIGLYEVNKPGETPSRYLALSEQSRSDADSPWRSKMKGITVRKGEVAAVIAALQSADFNAVSDNKHLSNEDYASQVLDEMISQGDRHNKDTSLQPDSNPSQE